MSLNGFLYGFLFLGWVKKNSRVKLWLFWCARRQGGLWRVLGLQKIFLKAVVHPVGTLLSANSNFGQKFFVISILKNLILIFWKQKHPSFPFLTSPHSLRLSVFYQNTISNLPSMLFREFCRIQPRPLRCPTSGRSPDQFHAQTLFVSERKQSQKYLHCWTLNHGRGTWPLWPIILNYT